MVIGWVENKDAKDDLNKEIKNKKEKQYPLLNTIFENSKELVLFQDGKEVIRVNMSKSEELDKVLIKFVSFRPEEYKKFQDAFNNLKRILPDLAKDLREFFKEEKKINKKFKENLKEFTKKCQLSINNNITEELAIEMIIQHMLTRDIFVIFFQNANFHMNNIISKSISNILTHINQKSFEITEKIKSYTDCLSSYTKTITKDDKQDILKTFYSDFYKALNSKKADVQGIEYTPIQIVKFMVDASEQLLYKHFNKKLSSRDVNILDPCSGTGIFMAEIINRINSKDLEYKYKNELFSNEIDIMPYYISNLNIENAYFERTNSYEIFENICFLDTLEFQTKLGNNALFGMEEFSEGNVKRAVRQYEKKINLIIGNPPYNANQKSENDNNKNKVYIDLDKRIKDTYVNLSSAQKTKQYDMYKRFIRWASDRIKSEDDGIIAFITNNAYLDSRQDDGFRKSVQKEFDYIYIIDLKGNARKRNKSEGGNVFNIQTGVAIMFLIKKGVSEKQNKINPLNQKKANIKYYNIGDFLSGDKKLMSLQQDISFFDFEDIIPDNKGQWLNQTNNDFYEHTALIDKNVKNQKVGKAIEQKAIFKLFTFCHAVLSSPKYQKEYEENLKIDYPRIPLYKNFDRFVELGKRLIKLQTEFENFDCRNEEIQLKIEKDFKYMPEDFSMIKLNKEKGIIIFDGKNRIENIPKKAFDYKIGTRSALDWIIDYYKPKKLNLQKELHHKTLIENGLNSYDYKKIREYLFELIPKVIEISVETVDIFKELEKLN